MATYQSLEQRPLSPASEDVDKDGTQASDYISNQHQINPTSGRGRTWRTGFLRRFPWIAGASALLAILCTAACVGVLAAANGSPVAQWRVAPSVVLAILAAVVNASLSLALAEAVNYRWWIQALSGRSTLNDLERVWMYGTSFGSALISGKHVNLIALASVVVTILAIDGPLLQRAISTIEKEVHVSQVPVNVTLADQIPLGYSGLEVQTAGDLLGSPLVSEQFQQVIRQFQQREPIFANSITGCYGICKGEIEGAGLQVDCEETTKTKQWLGQRSENDTVIQGTGGVFSAGEAFSISFGWSGDRNTSRPHRITDWQALLPLADGRPSDEAFMYMNLTWSPNGTIPSVEDRRSPSLSFDKYTNFIHQKRCKLYPGSARYPVLIKNNSIATTGNNEPAATTNTIELQGQSEFIPNSFQNTAKLIIDAINAAKEENPYGHDVGNLSDLALPNPSDRFSARRIVPDSDGHISDEVSLGPTMYLHGTLSGLATYLQNTYGSLTYIRKGRNGGGTANVGEEIPPDGEENDSSMVAEPSGPLSFQFLLKSSPALTQADLRIPILFFSDPTSFLLSTIDDLLFRIAVQTAFNNTFSTAFNLVKMSTYEMTSRNMTNEFQTGYTNSTMLLEEPFGYSRFPASRMVDMDVTHSVQVYKASYPFLGGAIAIIFLAVVLVVPLFHGFWRLGRQTSIGPLETAAALGAPILMGNGASSNGTARDIMKTVGMQRVRYGEVGGEGLGGAAAEGAGKEGRVGERRLQFERVERVERPTRGSIYS